MHELSLCGAIAEIVSRRAEGRPVGTVHLRVGQLRQVVPDSLTFCWTMLIEGTDLEGSVLHLEAVHGTLSCRSCAVTFPLPDPPVFACPHCGGLNVAVVTGEEFDITELEFVPA